MSNPILELFKSAIGKENFPTPSPVGNWLQGMLLEAEEGKLTFQFTIRKEMTNPVGILHGGMSALIMDDIIGATVHTLNRDTFYTSVNLSVDFLNSVPAGAKITATAEIVRSGKTIINAQCHIYNEKGEIIAKGMSNLVRTFQKK